MNSLQKKYELNCRLLNQNQRVSEYYRYLEQIRLKPNNFSINSEPVVLKKIINIPYKDPNVIRSNRRMITKLNSIIDEPVIPKINNEYLEVKELIRNNKDRYRDFQERSLSIENLNYRERVFSQKPRVEETKKLKKLYEETHEKYMRILRNSRTKNYENEYRKFSHNNSRFLLPPINAVNVSREPGEKIFQTEVNSKYDNDNYDNKSEEIESVKMNEHKYSEISHQRQGHING